ncbi:MAG: hypothetical protein JXR68_03060 [Bacteroidales bacterium]|nr:hypothetical protein [Bacteroidales bacterium]
MELRQKFKIVVWAFIFLLILNVSTILLILSKKNGSQPNYPPPNDSCFAHDNSGNMQMPQAGMFSDLIISELDLSDDQIGEFYSIRQNFMHKSHNVFDSIKYYNNIIDFELQNHNLDSSSLKLYSEKIGDFHAVLKINFVNYYVDIENILTEEQSKNLFSIFIEFKQQRQYHNNHQGHPNQNFGPGDGNGYGHKHRNRNKPF